MKTLKKTTEAPDLKPFILSLAGMVCKLKELVQPTKKAAKALNDFGISIRRFKRVSNGFTNEREEDPK
ncbi:MAG TPA: hypothetical protein ENI07_13190 [Desulfobacterales bacterium]|nr:hypothetical protein [Desulfobacterales bacterium]